jgi:glutamate-1-semialdehyde 2,1-aminomutase
VAGLAGSDALMGHLGAYDGSRATIDGTYNAAPYAMAAARKTLQIMEEGEVFPRIYALGQRLREGLQAAADDAGVPVSVAGLGSEWAVYFRPEPPTNFREALETDADAFGRYHAVMLEGGIIEPAFRNGDRRLSAATSDDDIDLTIEVAARAFRAAAG